MADDMMNRPAQNAPAMLLGLLALTAGLALASPACDSESTEPPPPGGSGGTGGETPGGSGGGAASGAEGGAGGGIGFVCGPTSLSSPACSSCVDDRCCDEARACGENAECPDWMSCYRACPLDDPDCVIDCNLDHGAGMLDGWPLTTCEQRYCNPECEHPEEAICGFYVGSEPEFQACQTCSVAECCEEAYARNHDPDVAQLFACWSPCTDDDFDCFYECLNQHPDGYTNHTLFLNCLTIECADECEPMLEWNTPCGFQQRESGDPACDSCMESQCCEAIGTVSASEEYYRYTACYYGCTDNACLRQCELDHTWGSALNNAMWSCVGTQCFAECSPYYSFLGPCGNIVNLDPSCNLCMQSDCCDEYTELGVNPEGQAYLLCVNNVSQNDEWAQCRVDWADGYVIDRVSGVCRYDHCATECNTTPPACGVRFDNLPDCGTCVEAQCCAATHDCMADYDCKRLDVCRYIHNCDLSDTACIDACRADHPAGVPLYDPYHACLTGPCTPECATW